MKKINTIRVLCTRQEAASYIKKSEKTIDRLIREGRIEAFKIGRRSVLIYEDSLTQENLTSIKPKFKNLMK